MLKASSVSKYTCACTSFLFLQSLFLNSPCFLSFSCSLSSRPVVFDLSLFMLLPFSPSFHLNFSLRGPAQCALLTPTPPNQCPSPTSAHTNLSASTPGPTFTRLTLSSTLTLMMRKNMTGGWSRATVPWPSPTNSPLRLNLQVTLHGASNLE